jgi:hypothetical protein
VRARAFVFVDQSNMESGRCAATHSVIASRYTSALVATVRSDWACVRILSIIAVCISALRRNTPSAIPSMTSVPWITTSPTFATTTSGANVTVIVVVVCVVAGSGVGACVVGGALGAGVGAVGEGVVGAPVVG